MSSKGGFLFFAYKRQILVSPELIRISSKNIFLFFAYKRQILVSPELIRISSKNIFLLFDYITNFGAGCAEGAANPKIGLIILLCNTCKAIARN
jgi:hypothetical protein